MKKLMNVAAVFAAVMGLSALAATELAVFEGADLDGGTVNGYKVTLNEGNTFANGVVTIGSQSGISVAKTDGTVFGSKDLTVLIRYSNLPTVASGQYGVMADFCNNWEAASAIDTLGVAVNSDKKIVGLWTAKSWNAATYKSTTALSATGDDFKTFAWTQNAYKPEGGKVVGPTVYENGANLSYSGIDQGLGDTQRNPKTIMIGGYAPDHSSATPDPDDLVNLTGMRVAGIAVYSGVLTAAEVAAFQWPSLGEKENAYLWLDASAAETITTNTSGQVTAWTTRSTSGKAATAYTAGGVTVGPSVAVGALAKRDVIDFGAVKSGKDLEIPAASNIRAVFMVTAIDDSEDAFILGGDESFSGTAQYHFHRDSTDSGRSSNFTYFHNSNSAAALRNGQIRRNRAATTYDTAIPTGYGLITLIPTGDVCASRLCQDRAIAGRTGGKRIAELIIFTVPITDAQRDAVEAYLMNKWFIEVPTPTGSLGFDSGKGASKVVGGSALTGMADWDDHLTPAYTRVRGNASDYALGVNFVDTGNKVAPYAAVPSGMSDSRSWSVHASMKLAEVKDGVLFSLSGATYENNPYLGVEYCDHDQVRVVYGTAKGAANKQQLIAPMTVPDATTAYHSYLLTFDATATSGRYALYIDGVKAGDSGSAARLTGYAVDWSVGNYYGGAEEVGSAVFHEALADDFAIWKDTCLYASQAKGLAAKLPVWAAKYAAAVEADADFLDLPWSPALPAGTTTFTGSEFVLTNASAAGVTKVTFAGPTAVDKLTVLSAEDCETEFCAFSNLTATAIDFSRAFGGVGFRVPADWEVTDPLREYLRNNEITISFSATGENGVTFDYGLDNTASTKGHYVFNGGRHAFTYGVGSPDLAFSVTGTLENPSLLVKDATTLDYTVKDMNGWCGGLKATSVVRAETGATLNILQSGQKTVFMNGRLVLEPGSTTTFDINEGAYGLCVYGGVPSDPTLAQIYVPSPSSGRAASPLAAVLRQVGAKPLDIRRSTDGTGGTGGAAITVEADGALEIASPVMGDQPLTKYGAGTVDFLDTITNYTGVLTVAEGTVVLRMTRGLTIGGAGRVHITLTPEEESSKASITIFTPAEGSTVTIGRILDSSGADVTTQYTISGNTIRRKPRGLMLFTK